MRVASRWGIPVLCAIGAFLLAGWVLTRHAVSQTDAKPVPVKYEYSSSVVDANSLQPKFDELVNGGWEVLSVTTAETVLDQGVENKPRLIVEKYLVVGRRPGK